MDGSLRRLNELARDEAEALMLKCCGSSAWARAMVASRPFADTNDLLEASDRVWWSLAPEDWLEAFKSHPKIGERKSERETSADAQAWAASEQSSMKRASNETASALAQGNREYERKFGYIFIICATGKSADEMLSLLRERLNNGANLELRIAAEEQRRITRLRLQKLLET